MQLDVSTYWIGLPVILLEIWSVRIIALWSLDPAKSEPPVRSIVSAADANLF